MDNNSKKVIGIKKYYGKKKKSKNQEAIDKINKSKKPVTIEGKYK